MRCHPTAGDSAPGRESPPTGSATIRRWRFAGDGSIVVAWDELAGGSRRIGLARGVVDPSGRIELTRTPVEGSDGGAAVGSYPVVAPAGAHVLVAWTSTADSQSTIRLVRRRM